MRKYKCNDCGCVFTDEEAGTRTENVGEFWGEPAYKEFIVCPRCDSDDYERCEDDEEEE